MHGTLVSGVGRGQQVHLGSLLMLLALSACSWRVTGVSLQPREEGEHQPTATQTNLSTTHNLTTHHMSTSNRLTTGGHLHPGAAPRLEEKLIDTSTTGSRMLQLLPGILEKMWDEGDTNNPMRHAKNEEEEGEVHPEHRKTQLTHKGWDTERIKSSSIHQNTTSRVTKLQMYIKSILQILSSKVQNHPTSSHAETKSSQLLPIKLNPTKYVNSTPSQVAAIKSNINSHQVVNVDENKSRLNDAAAATDVTSRSYNDVIGRVRRSANAKRHERSRSKSRSKRFRLKKMQRVVRLVREPWLLAVSDNGSVYATKEVHNPHTIFISHPVDAQLVAFETNNTRKYLTFHKNGHLSTTRMLNRRTHFIVSQTIDNRFTYLSKYRARHYWYLGISDVGNLTTYSKSRSRKNKKRPGKGKKRRDKSSKTTTKTARTRGTRVARAVPEQDFEELWPTESPQILDDVAAFEKGERLSETLGVSERGADPVDVRELFEADAISEKTSAPSLNRDETTTKPQPTQRHSKRRQKPGHRKKSNRRRRKGHRCKSQNCTCIRNNAIAPWCQFQILPVGETDNNDWLWYKSALELSRAAAPS